MMFCFGILPVTLPKFGLLAVLSAVSFAVAGGVTASSVSTLDKR